jgi:ATP-dependent RNA helicase DHX8/PRP22
MWIKSKIGVWCKDDAKEMFDDVDDDEMDEEDDIEIELNETEAPFLRNQTTKGGIYLSPIRVVKVPDGTLEREAENAK